MHTYLPQDRRRALARGESLPDRTAGAALFAGPAVDAFVTVHTFSFWPDPLDAARQLVALLAPGGQLVSIFATTRTRPDGTRKAWPVHAQASALAEQRGLQVALRSGPNSRQFNNLALMVSRAPVP